MTSPHAGSERLYRRLLRVYPAEFRARFADEMVQLFNDQLREARTGRTAGSAVVWLRSLGDLVVTSTSEHLRRDRTVAHSLSASPSTLNRLLGLAGVLGGAVLLAVFVIDIGSELNVLRLALFNLGAIAIVIAVHRRQVTAAPRLSLIGAVPALIANAWYLGMIVLESVRPEAFAGDLALAGFYAAVAMWLADALFALVTLRIGVLARWGALALAIGSPLALVGIDRLGLVSAQDATIFGPLSQIGIVLNGLGWILLGIDLATRPGSEVQGREDRLRD